MAVSNLEAVVLPSLIFWPLEQGRLNSCSYIHDTFETSWGRQCNSGLK